MGAAQASRGFVLEQRDVGEEVPAGELQLDQGPVALASGVTVRADRTQVPAVGSLHQSETIEQLPDKAMPATPVTSSSVASTTTDATRCYGLLKTGSSISKSSGVIFTWLVLLRLGASALW